MGTHRWREVDRYNAIAIWYFGADKDPDRFLKIFEGVIPKIPGLEWSLVTGWTCVPSDGLTNMIWDGSAK